MPKMPRDLPIWNYFGESNCKYKTAVCNYCQRELSYKTTITNLKAHLKQRHNDIYNEFLSLAKIADRPSSEQKPSNDESDVEESPNNTYQEVVYLYDSDSKGTKKEVADARPVKKVETQTPIIVPVEMEKEKEKRERAKSNSIDRRKRRRMSMFVEEDSTPAKSDPDAEDEEIDKFGKYIVCLMKTVPKELCTQLQMDMINLIMTTKIKYMAKPTEPSSEVTRNVEGDSFVVMNEGEKVQHMQITEDDGNKTTTDANQQGTYEEVVYMQDANTKTVKEIRLKKLDGTDKKQMESEHRKRRLMSTYPGDLKAVDEEEIEKFGKYVTCLMKTVPNELCTQLQMDIINTIMRGKIKYMTSPAPNVIVEKVQTNFSPSIIVTMGNETAHMPFLETNTVVASQA